MKGFTVDTATVTIMSDVFGMPEYEVSVTAGHIKTRPHFEFPYQIHNYTPACVWEKGWNTATLACRGLVTHAETGEVIARPFGKFFNLSEVEAVSSVDYDSPVEVTEKVDGSLGILIPTPDGGWIISTRGSFYSEQALWATRHYALNHAGFEPNRGWTYLFEIIYSDNRIVLSYDFEGLVLLGAIDIATGTSVPLSEAAVGWGGRVTEVHSYSSMREVIASGERDDAEGFVVRNIATDMRIKVKHEVYCRLHKYLTNTTERHIWEVLFSGEEPATIFASAPDEFHQWMRIIETQFRKDFNVLRDEAISGFNRVCAELNLTYGQDVWGRGDFAALAKNQVNSALLFSLLDGRDISKNVWLSLKPVGETQVMKVVSLDEN